MSRCRTCLPAAVAALALAAAPPSHAQTVITTNFVETIAVFTDTFESSSGVPLFTDTAVGVSDTLSPGAASYLETNPAVPAVAQAALPLIPQVSEYQFLSGQGDPYIIFNGNLFLAPFGDITYYQSYLDVEGEPSGYTPINHTVPFAESVYYSTGALVPPANTDILDGTATFNIVTVNYVFQPSATAVPEPSAFALLALGLVPLALGLVPLALGLVPLLLRARQKDFR